MTTEKTISNRTYGYIKDLKDIRDKLVKFLHRNHKKPIFDLRNIVKLPPALSDINQENLGSCTANAIAYAYAFDELKQSNKEVFLPSRLFIYYNERLLEGTVNTDSGAMIRDGIKTLNKYGVCDEHHWPYDVSKFTVKPSDELYEEAKLATAVSYASIDLTGDSTSNDRVNHLKNALKNGFPFVFGFTVYESFETKEVANTGIMPMPKPGENILGGHAVCAIGFDDNKQSFIVKNSWGPNWGLNGYFYFPYEYMANENLTSDFWVIQKITDPNNIPNFSPDDIEPDNIN